VLGTGRLRRQEVSATGGGEQTTTSSTKARADSSILAKRPRNHSLLEERLLFWWGYGCQLDDGVERRKEPTLPQTATDSSNTGQKLRTVGSRLEGRVEAVLAMVVATVGNGKSNKQPLLPIKSRAVASISGQKTEN